MKFKDRTIIVTGAGSGFGAAIARSFASEGGAVAVADIRAEAAKKVAQEIRQTGGRAIAVEADVSTRKGNERMVEQTLRELGSIQVLVNNAGLPQPPVFFTELTEEYLDKLYAVNAKSIYFGAASVFPHLKESGGAIVNITSVAATRPRANLSAYASSKAAALSLTKALAIELAPYRIRVNAVAPVAGDTPMLEVFMDGRTDQKTASYNSTIPLGRLCTPADVAFATLFLASDEASLITGTELLVDGGRAV